MFPSNVVPVKLVAEAMMRAGRPAEALGYLSIWKKPLNPRKRCRRIYFQGTSVPGGRIRPQDTVEADRPYLPYMLAHPDESTSDLMVYAAAARTRQENPSRRRRSSGRWWKKILNGKSDDWW